MCVPIIVTTHIKNIFTEGELQRDSYFQQQAHP